VIELVGGDGGEGGDGAVEYIVRAYDLGYHTPLTISCWTCAIRQQK
jgi:hypothetical protein